MEVESTHEENQNLSMEEGKERTVSRALTIVFKRRNRQGGVSRFRIS
jgi:hypothetical protein